MSFIRLEYLFTAIRDSHVPSVAAVTLVLAVAGAASVSGQAPRLLETGARVRITSPSRGWLRATATVADARDDGLVVLIDSGDRLQAVDLASISEMDVSTGRRSRAMEGFGIGFIAGAVVGGVLGSTSAEDGWRGVGALVYAGVLAVPGAIVGLNIGGAMEREVWVGASTSAGGLTVAPVARGSGAGLSMGWALAIR